MKTKRIRAGEYTFKNDQGFEGLILSQPEGGWSVFNPNAGHISSLDGKPVGDTMDFFMTKGEAVGFASGITADGSTLSRV
jgi:hypothetical protein